MQPKKKKKGHTFLKEPKRKVPLKSIITEMKKLLKELNSRCELVEERIKETEDKSKEIMQSEEKKEERMKKRNSLRDSRYH